MRHSSPIAIAIFALTLAPAASWAEVCDKMASDWSSSGGVVEQLVPLLPQMIVILIAAVSLYADVCAWLLFAAMVAFAYVALDLFSITDSVQIAARAEGCRGPLYVVATFFGALSLLLTQRALRKRPIPQGKP